MDCFVLRGCATHKNYTLYSGYATTDRTCYSDIYEYIQYTYTAHTQTHAISARYSFDATVAIHQNSYINSTSI